MKAASNESGGTPSNDVGSSFTLDVGATGVFALPRVSRTARAAPLESIHGENEVRSSMVRTPPSAGASSRIRPPTENGESAPTCMESLGAVFTSKLPPIVVALRIRSSSPGFPVTVKLPPMSTASDVPPVLPTRTIEWARWRSDTWTRRSPRGWIQVSPIEAESSKPNMPETKNGPRENRTPTPLIESSPWDETTPPHSNPSFGSLAD